MARVASEGVTVIRRRIALAVLAVALVGQLTSAQREVAHQTLAPDNVTALSFTVTDGGLTCGAGACAAGTAAGIQGCYITIDTAAVRWFDDGATPTASVGNPQATGTTIYLKGLSNCVAFKVIAQTAGPAAVIGNFDRP